MKISKIQNLFLCLLAYLIALAVALLTGYWLRDWHDLLIIAGADLAATVAIFAFSLAFNNSSFYDAYWSVTPIVIALFLLLNPVADVNLVRQGIVFLLVFLWGIRLTYNWARGWDGLHHEDWRYVQFREQYSRSYLLINFFGIHLVPTILVFLGCLSLYPALSSGTKSLSLLDGLAFIVTLTAIVIEATADEQLRAFKGSQKEAGAILATGLWAYSRHPNYFGELLFWWGLFLFALAAATFSQIWWALLGPLAMIWLFFFISIPMLDKRMLKKRPAYAEHMQKVSGLVPWFRVD